jgi:prepilin-type processing-associated H-X9-DG protein
MTSYVAVVGPDTAWPGARSTKLGDITDGTSNTLLVVEVADSGIHWMEPRDLHVLQMAPTVNPQAGQGISSRHPGGAQASLADGSVRYLSEELSEEKLRALLTIAGGEPLGADDF